MTIDEKIERKMVHVMNHENMEYEFSRLIAWALWKTGQPGNMYIAGHWNLANDRVHGAWHNAKFKTWVSFLDQNMHAFKACQEEMQTNGHLYEKDWFC